MKYDTREKKPKIWSIAALTAVAAALSITLAITGAEKHAVAISAVLDAFFLTVIVLLVRGFFAQLQYNPYSYNSIYYMGFSLFLLWVR